MRIQKSTLLTLIITALWCLTLVGTVSAGNDSSNLGYYRYPAIHDQTIVFTAEGDLWQVGIEGGLARRLTTHADEESMPSISPDGKLLAFSARYEGPTEVYVMPLTGGVPTRLTYEGENSRVVGWTPDRKLLYSTSHYSTLPRSQLARIDVETGDRELLPLAQARYGAYDGSGKTLYFNRFPFQGSYTKRYKGGTAQSIWKYSEGDREAVDLTVDFPGTNAEPMWWQKRVYFVSDRDGTKNLWSMDEAGGNLKQHTSHKGWDVMSPSLSDGKIAYQLGADIHVYDIVASKDRKLDIRLSSDFDQMREQWITKPMDWLTSAHVSADGEKVALTARGQVFTAPVESGRFVRATRDNAVRYRNAMFMADGKSLLAMTDQTGEIEFCTIPADGIGEVKVLTDNGRVFRFDMVPSPDGKYFAYYDKDNNLFVYEIEGGKQKTVVENADNRPSDLTWSPDSKWLAYVLPADNYYGQILLYNVENGERVTLTNDRYENYAPAFSPDGKWLYFLSQRTFSTIYGNVWGSRQEEPYIDKTTKLYAISLLKDFTSPFEPENELSDQKSDADKNGDDEEKSEEKEDKADGKAKDKADAKPGVVIDIDGIQTRLIEVPIAAGNYFSLTANDKHLFWISRNGAGSNTRNLMAAKIASEDMEARELVGGIDGYELSADGDHLLVRKGDDLYVIGASASAPSNLKDSKVDLSGWAFSLDPRQEWRQMFIEAWRLERDYFYDRGMHGVDWPAMRDKYLPLVDRITDRRELSDLLGQLVGELSALHIYVFGGDMRNGEDDVHHAGLGAMLIRDKKAGGYRIEHIYQNDPDYPSSLSPLAKPGLDIRAGDVIEAINGVKLLTIDDPGALLRGEAGQQVRLQIKDVSADKSRDVIVTPISSGQERELRYDEWEYTRRLQVEELSGGDIGYVHLRAMGGGDFTQWARDFYPVFKRKGLIVDVRDNSGGNIDSWIIGRLMRKAWAYWQSREGTPYSNMQYAFNGHIAVLCNEWTASDGELFAEGIRRLGLGTVIGTRTWGGEIWLSYGNRLVDRGIATAAESGVFAPEGQWLIEGHGVDPDIVVDNLPHATFGGSDAQIEAAVEHLKEQIRLHPIEAPTLPPYPDKSLK